MKKLLSLFMVLLIGSGAFGDYGDIIWSDSFEYADQAAFEAAGWTNTFVSYTFGDMPGLTAAVAYDGSQSFYKDGEQQEAREVLDWALNKLSAEDRMVIELVYLEGLSGKEAAELLGWSVTNVKVRSFRSRKKLQKLLMKAQNRE